MRKVTKEERKYFKNLLNEMDREISKKTEELDDLMAARRGIMSVINVGKLYSIKDIKSKIFEKDIKKKIKKGD